MRTGDRDTFNLPDIPSVDSISSVTVYVNAMKSADANPSPKIKIMIRTYGTDYYSDDISLSTSYTLYSYNWATNPTTGLSWTADEVNALEAGVRHSTETSLTYGVFRVAQVYVEVTYKLPTTTSTSLSASTITLGGPVTDTATVTPAAATGQVTFYVKAPSGSWVQFGAVKTLSAGSATSDSYTPTRAGTWYFKAAYSGDDNYLGSESDETAEPLTVEPPPEPPVASFTESAETVTVGETITFDPSASYDPDGTIVLYEWDFDGDSTYDLSTATPDTVSYTYTALGTYTVTLRVTDDDGLIDTATATKTVEPKIPPGIPEFGLSVSIVTSVIAALYILIRRRTSNRKG